MSAPRTTRQQIQHLLRRAGFGYRWDELDEYERLGLEGTVERLLAPAAVDDSAADGVVAVALTPFGLDPTNKDAMREQRSALFAGWYTRLAVSRRPLLERMTYFWHDHFATGIGKVGNPLYMQQQNETLRKHALGSFRDLLLDVTRDPAMMVWLDNRSNTRTAPNENYARELLELHTLGEGNGYTERDIKEAARALTGWRLQDGAPVFRANLHDSGVKTVLGASGRFNDEGLVDMLASHPGTAAYIADKLVRFFVRPDGDAALAKRAADAFLASRGSIERVMRLLLLSPEMYSDTAYRSMVKSPVELVVGAKRALEGAVDGRSEPDTTRRMGQLLFDPPNPAGWTPGVAWVNATTMLMRANFANELTMLRGQRAANVGELFRKYGITRSADQVVDWTLDLLVGGDVDAGTRSVLVEHIGGRHHFDFERAAREGTLHGMVYLALSMPLYQVA